MVSSAKLSCRAWFAWAEAEIANPDGLRAVLISVAKNLVQDERAGHYFAEATVLGQLERKHAAPEVRRKYPQASEDLAVFLLERLAQQPRQRMAAIRICEALTRENIPETAAARLEILRLNIAGRSPQIELHSVPSARQMKGLVQTAAQAERKVGREGALAQRAAYQFMQAFQQRPAA